MNNLVDPVALVIGAAGGIGRATARRLSASNTKVVGADVDWASTPAPEPFERATVDVTVAGSVAKCVAQAVRDYGRLDSLVFAAGIIQREPAERVTAADWERIFAVNVRGAFVACQAVEPIMSRQGSGSIVLISSQLALAASSERAPYIATKAALLGLTRSLAVEWASRGIRVNAVAPGLTNTAMTELLGANPATRAKLTARIPMGRFASPEEIANAIAFLSSSDASYITGHTLIVDGGYSVA